MIHHLNFIIQALKSYEIRRQHAYVLYVNTQFILKHD